ncbi:MAG TPA: mechanosensitive ion channel family protein [Chloroflexota bacterium]|nr:mechanosensitive ion channel family protein [Chloroflexota bacterium]
MFATLVPVSVSQFSELLIALGVEAGLAILVIAVTYLLARLARGRLRDGLVRGGFQVNVAVLLSRVMWFGVWGLGIVAFLSIIGVGLTPLAAFVGVLGLAASLALQQLLQNLVAGIYLLAERPFHIGDLIQVIGPAGANHEGRVQDIQMRTTLLRNLRDELILVPNSSLFAGVVTNRSAIGGFVTSLSVTLPRSLAPEQVRDQIVRSVRDVKGVLTEPAPEFRVCQVEKDTWTGTLLLWVAGPDATSDAMWSVASAYPDATLSAEGVTS